MLLQRTNFLETGIFGSLFFYGDNEEFAKTLEHAYLQEDGKYLPKIPAGKYWCVRGTHQISNEFFETFEIMGVPGHTGLLFHPGNFNNDSSGCILLGEEISNFSMITESRNKFLEFMNALNGVTSFHIEIV